MNPTIETIPQLWDDERDVQFFRIIAALFAPDFCHGAGVLLASYEPEDTLAELALAVACYDAAPTQMPTATTSINPRSTS
jgi:hypothetical protein